jgi:alanine-glyoxylate transaminase/serine-glyoxylate transaminase/serine-pyruvate transaminase
MIPGPVSVEDDVLHEMAQPVRPHYGADWTEVYDETRDLLKQVIRTRGDVHILVGSGTAALDAGIGSLTSTGEVAIVGVNGFFGDRLVEICESYGLQVVPVHAPLGEQLNPQAFGEALGRHPEAALVTLVHLETATAVLNPLQEVAQVARRHSVPVVVDAVSSLAGAPLEMDEWGIDIVASATQKGLGAPPGLGPIAISSRAWEIMDSKPDRRHGWYLNLQTWRRFATDWGAWHPHPITMATNNVMALRASLQKLLAEGLEARIARYTQLALRLRGGVRRLGLQPLTPDSELAPVLTAVYGPEGVRSSEIVKYLREEHGLRISGGLGEGLADRVFRVGHMGPRVNEQDIDLVLSGLEGFLQRRGILQVAS